MRIAQAALAASLLCLPIRAQAVTAYASQFGVKGLAGWTLSATLPAQAGMAVEKKVAGATRPVLDVYEDAPPAYGSASFASASQSFTVKRAGAYSVTANVMSVPCSGCVIGYAISVDGSDVAAGASNGAWVAINVPAGTLTRGTHTLTLSMRTQPAISSGHFAAYFDRVMVITTPPPAPAPH